VQRTWLAEPGRKAALATPKAALGAIGGCGVVLGEIADAVVIAEGLESALSASVALGLPAVAALGCANLRRLAIPDRVRRVVIAPDRDASGAGERAARDLGQTLIKRGCSAALAWPPAPFADWNDAAQAGAINRGGS
jgi:putative DNA primase/helicase